MTKAKEQVVVFLVGALGYGGVELLWRQKTHWSMLLTGGCCFSILYNVYNIYKQISLREKCFFGSLVITLLELVVGMFVNLKKKWQVWDYSKLPFHFMGQICLLYSSLWFLLSGGLVFFSGFLKRYFTKNMG